MLHTTKSGVELEIIGGDRLALQDILVKAGLLDQLKGKMGADAVRGTVSRALERDTGRVVAAFQQLFNYCLGWCITTNPPQEAVEELDELGFGGRSERARRINWLRYLVLQDENEAMEVLGLAMNETLAVAPEPEPGPDSDEDEDE